jgi:hypothetical protein
MPQEPENMSISALRREFFTLFGHFPTLPLEKSQLAAEIRRKRAENTENRPENTQNRPENTENRPQNTENRSENAENGPDRPENGSNQPESGPNRPENGSSAPNLPENGGFWRVLREKWEQNTDPGLRMPIILVFAAIFCVLAAKIAAKTGLFGAFSPETAEFPSENAEFRSENAEFRSENDGQATFSAEQTGGFRFFWLESLVLSAVLTLFGNFGRFFGRAG